MIKTFSLEKIKIFFLVILLLFLFSLNPQKPQSISVKVNFGGTVIGLIPTCNGGSSSLVFIKPPGSFPPKVLYEYGISYSFEWLPPTHSKQELLGAAGIPLTCIVGVCPSCTTVGAGPIVVFHGASV